ncbi:MAG: hypothetical protein OXD54_06880 [Candidatus Poribacteria bacterium]|nr:hypothetical protein [Candidatus Poribacteria bacterium]
MSTAVEMSNLPLYRIANYCEITYQTLRKWLKDGEDYQKQIEDSKMLFLLKYLLI